MGDATARPGAGGTPPAAARPGHAEPIATTLAERIDAALPQTQCRRCGYDDCRAYAEALAAGQAGIDRCPPGGAEGVRRLAAITGRPAVPLEPSCGAEGPRRVALIDEDWCIGCTLCIQACPVDAIAGAPKRMHSVLADHCTGCELCLPPCPTDCIAMLPLADPALRDATAWDAWTPQQADAARRAHQARAARAARVATERAERLAAKAVERGHMVAADPDPDAAEHARKQAVIAAALERARARQAGRR